jgi:YVTN family beta-propeller protein
MAVNPAGTFAYVANQLSNTVSMYAINAATGILTALSTPTVTTGPYPVSIAVNPAGTFAYVANYGSTTVSMYAINATTGVLTALATPTVATGTSPAGIAFK